MFTESCTRGNRPTLSPEHLLQFQHDPPDDGEPIELSRIIAGHRWRILLVALPPFAVDSVAKIICIDPAEISELAGLIRIAHSLTCGEQAAAETVV